MIKFSMTEMRKEIEGAIWNDFQENPEKLMEAIQGGFRGTGEWDEEEIVEKFAEIRDMEVEDIIVIK